MINQIFLPYVCQQDRFLISTDPEKLDISTIYQYLTAESYWAKGISKELVQRRVNFSLCFGVYELLSVGEKQIGFARAVTDFTTCAYLADLFILPAHQGQGLGKWLVETILAYPELQGLRRWTLHTKDAHTLYAKYGFEPYPIPADYLEYLPDRAVSVDETAVSSSSSSLSKKEL